MIECTDSAIRDFYLTDENDVVVGILEVEFAVKASCHESWIEVTGWTLDLGGEKPTTIKGVAERAVDISFQPEMAEFLNRDAFAEWRAWLDREAQADRSLFQQRRI